MSENGFGPDGAVATGAAPFSVTAPTSVKLTGERTATVSFAVANLTGREVRARLLPVPVNGADAAWLSVVGEPERKIGMASTFDVEVRVAVGPQTPAGTHGVRLDVAVEDHPDQVTTGQVVTFDVPAPAPHKPFPWWIVIVAVVAVLVLVGGGLVIRHLTRDDDVAPTSIARPTIAGTAMVGATLSATPGRWADGVVIATRWQVCPIANLTDCTDVPGAEGTSFVVGADLVGRRLRVVEIASIGPSDPKTGKAPGPTASAFSEVTAFVKPPMEATVLVPGVTGRSLSEATQLLADAKLQGLQVNTGIIGDSCDPEVVSQNPGSGTQAAVGSKVAIATARIPIFCLKFLGPIVVEKRKLNIDVFQE